MVPSFFPATLGGCLRIGAIGVASAITAALTSLRNAVRHVSLRFHARCIELGVNIVTVFHLIFPSTLSQPIRAAFERSLEFLGRNYPLTLGEKICLLRLVSDPDTREELQKSFDFFVDPKSVTLQQCFDPEMPHNWGWVFAALKYPNNRVFLTLIKDMLRPHPYTQANEESVTRIAQFYSANGDIPGEYPELLHNQGSGQRTNWEIMERDRPFYWPHSKIGLSIHWAPLGFKNDGDICLEYQQKITYFLGHQQLSETAVLNLEAFADNLDAEDRYWIMDLLRILLCAAENIDQRMHDSFEKYVPEHKKEWWFENEGVRQRQLFDTFIEFAENSLHNLFSLHQTIGRD